MKVLHPYKSLLLLLFCCLIGSQLQAQKPNVVLILADDLGYGDLASYGHQHIKTPALDQLAKEGMKFTNFYSPSPLCSPSRASILTGRTPFRTGIKSWIPQGKDIYLHQQETTLATILSKNGYQTFLSGKWHLNGGLDEARHTQPQDHGFDQWMALHAFALPNHKNPNNIFEDGKPLGEIEGFTADIFVDQAIEYLEDRDQNKPFFLYLPMAEPHSEIASPDDFNAQYASFTKGTIDLKKLSNRGPGEYYANIAYMDHQIGRLLQFLDDKKLTDNTIVVFLSDNGPVTIEWRHWYEVNLFGDTGGLRGRKADLFDGGIRVPCIIRYPKLIKPNSISDHPLHGYDLVPTLCSVLNVPLPSNYEVDGFDFSGIWNGKKTARAEPLFWAFETRADDNPSGFQYAVRDGDWKLITDAAVQKTLLFNLADDPFEVKDLSKLNPKIVSRLKDAIIVKKDKIKNDPLRPPLQEARKKEVTLLYTNDIESVYDPIDAYWIDSVKYIGGIPQLASLIEEVRAEEDLSFLFDAGDIFTGALSKSTLGVLPFEVYSTMGYDAMAIGNHEFEYGVKQLLNCKQHARFPVLNANIFYENTDINYAQSFAIVERDGVRIGVISVMGVEAFMNTIFKDNRAGLEVKNPIPIVQKLVDQLEPQVDVIIALTHQNKSAPMQSDKEIDPDVQRGFDEDYELAGAVNGLDVIFGGHSDHGLHEPVRHPETGTLIGLTFGQGQHLGYMKLMLDLDTKDLTLKEGKLIPVFSERLKAHQKISEMIEQVRSDHPELTEIIGENMHTGYRKYYRESNMGNFIADVCKEKSGADIGFITPGAIRKDLDVGPITVEDLLNVYPFVDLLAVTEISGKELKGLIEYGLSLTYGLAQYSGLELVFDSSKPIGKRMISAKVNGKKIKDKKSYTIASSAYSITGGDGLSMLANGKRIKKDLPMLKKALMDYIKEQKQLKLPGVGRQKDVAK